MLPMGQIQTSLFIPARSFLWSHDKCALPAPLKASSQQLISFFSSTYVTAGCKEQGEGGEGYWHFSPLPNPSKGLSPFPRKTFPSAASITPALPPTVPKGLPSSPAASHSPPAGGPRPAPAAEQTPPRSAPPSRPRAGPADPPAPASVGASAGPARPPAPAAAPPAQTRERER